MKSESSKLAMITQTPTSSSSLWYCYETIPGTKLLIILGDDATLFTASLFTSVCHNGNFFAAKWRRACFVRWSLRIKRRPHKGHT